MSTLELVWQQDPSAFAFARDGDGALSAGGLTVGAPASATSRWSGRRNNRERSGRKTKPGATPRGYGELESKSLSCVNATTTKHW